tara:strand:+ start:317 stop:775 length:459 start_codon:yes stop_codon:yes gene_type:complete
MSLYGLIVLLVLVICQLGGVWVNSNIPQNTSIEINNFLYLTHIRNFGGIFGLAQNMGWLFGLISLILLAGVSVYLWKHSSAQRYEYVCFGFIVGGGLSNVLDRLIYGSVIDFIDFQNIPLWNYIFNTADLMIHIGIWPMLILSLNISKNSSN